MNRDEDYNSELFLRPRFSIECERKASDVLQTILTNIEKNKNAFKTTVSGNHVFIDIPEKKSHFWSPQLHFRVEEDEGVTKIKGLFGPKSQVWTLFMFIHFIIATAFIGFAIMFYVRNRLGESIVFPVVMMIVLPITWFLLYFMGQLGKETSKNQMEELKKFMYVLLERVNYFL